MPVGSEWWGALYRTLINQVGGDMRSPMPVGSEWWGAYSLETTKGQVVLAGRQCLSAVSGGVPSLEEPKPITPAKGSPMPVGSEWCGAKLWQKQYEQGRHKRSPMPVGSEWWGAMHNSRTMTLPQNHRSPMPVGSEWWGATKGAEAARLHRVANACRQ